MPAPYRVALLGFSPFERNTLASYFRLATHRSPSYTLVQTLTDPDFMVADADHGPSVQLALAEEMLALTVFIGTQPPAGATAWMKRPIDPLHVMRELDAMVGLLGAAAAAAPAQPAPRPAPDADPHGDDLPTLILPSPGRALPIDSEPAVHGQRTVTLPRRFRRGTFIEEAYEGDGSSLPLLPQTPQMPEMPEQPHLAEPVQSKVVPEIEAPPQALPAPMPPPVPDVPGSVDLDTSAPAPTISLPAPRGAAPEPVAMLPPCALLVDDSELARHFLARLLEPWGVVCDQAPSSHQALLCLAERDYDFIFLDMELGADSEQDGLSLCQQIKRRHTNVQAALATVVMVSAHHSEIDRVRGSLAGCDAYLGKPLKMDELQQLLLRQGLKPPAGAAQRPPTARPA
jgi:CheY-like chemotaxis protein